ncbi:EPIDERMAL PATTERNING FACTOR-like protein 6 [Tripterygium wilfordii]|uniref:EPIDERMAL PATTERNING FACTOR-like protein 6 n=1 Tax=Tripterygium wilfordii TaxID=458696 RepID=UPI0018F7F194|nr:EPIDERMAL PATTERNING FACTOR-like protein 6 [Tripterygium wilfordii]
MEHYCWKLRSQTSFTRPSLIYCLVIFVLFTTTMTCCLDISFTSMSGKADLYFQEQKLDKKPRQEDSKLGSSSGTGSRRLLSGPGSSPPRCNSKCGKCTPCKAVHVPVPPGTPVTAEYYPEAWRCKCGNRLYMP